MSEPAQIERVRTRVQEFDRLHRYMRGRSGVARRYPTIAPRYERAMAAADKARAQVGTGMRTADDAYHYGQAAFGREAAQQGLGFWPYLIWGAGIGVAGLLGYRATELVHIDKCIERARELEQQGVSPEKASQIACPTDYDPTWPETASSVAMAGVAIAGIFTLGKLVDEHWR